MDDADAILILDNIFIKEKPLFTKIIIENKEYSLNEINKIEIKISFTPLEKEFGYKIINITFVYSETEETHYIEVISGINTGILFPGIGKTRDIIFQEEGKYKIEIIINKLLS